MDAKRIKVTVLGGSALATPKLFEVIGKSAPQCGYDFFLSGRDAERLSLVAKVSEQIVRSFPGLDVRIFPTNNLEASLEGADYVINQVRAGGLEGRAFDETFPRKFGIPGEETVGPGGFTNSMRGIPVILQICQTIEKVAPQAVLLNMTNPSSIIQYAIRRYSKVKVIGICDSPVALMEMVANTLQVPVKELDFQLGGMHHFGWISSVLHDGKECLPELLLRSSEMPKLGVDSQAVQALQVIPSLYAKYYIHPDRILAATEGRKIRAHELMEIGDQLLEAYRLWKPGQPTDMINKRPAGWYEKIVAPALLALTEKHTTCLVLSLDNRGTLPWLPDDAIVELATMVKDGEIQQPFGVDLPRPIQAMVSRNCAYEMLAAEAIAEQNRDTALRALMTNLLVSNFNQARGILQFVWPEERISAAKLVQAIAKPAKPEPLQVPTLHYGDDLLENFSLPEKDYALVTMEEPWELAKDRIKQQPKQVIFVRELDWYKLEALERGLPEVSAVVGLGGGTATDAAKYLAWRRHMPVDVIPSITSVDAAVTKSIAARSGGHVTYIGYIVPREVYIDYRLVRGAPPRLNISGVGDILTSYTALWDWKLAYERTGERYDPVAVSQMQAWLERIQRDADEIRQVSRLGIRTIMDAFADISVICRQYGSSRPQEASDHTFAYNAEFQTHKSFLHGELVSLGTYVMAHLQENDTRYLEDVFEKTGIKWQPGEIGLTKDEFVRTLSTLSWYQKNFGRRYSILDVKTIPQSFIDQMVSSLEF